MLHLKFSGQAREVDSLVNGTFSAEKGEGILNVEVKVFSQMESFSQVRILYLKFGHFKSWIGCTMKISVTMTKKVW